MDLQLSARLQSHHWARRAPDWLAAGVAGFVAGAVLMTLELAWAALSPDTSVWYGSHQVAAIALGRDALQSNAFSWGIVATALAIHYLLGITFGLLLAAIIAPFHLDSSWHAVLSAGALFGAVLYGINFYGMSQVFGWFAEMRGAGTFCAHLVFGMVAAAAYRQLERPVAKR
ncbi:hypothetical protein [Ideonella sp. BN130291]|uniref:hypothetical protein n=1 Tax=Ideonella sp. BN130291 TaxID=3112940 RepID=UPI002E25FC64|nr:hypothetical protein [Ideonella sp. BN130291]